MFLQEYSQVVPEAYKLDAEGTALNGKGLLAYIGNWNCNVPLLLSTSNVSGKVIMLKEGMEVTT
jgi:hypothetical protein